MNTQLLIAGGGIGGMALALAATRSGVKADVLEQAAEFSEVGAGIQLGPNAVRVLHDWGLIEPLRAVAAFPRALRVRDAHDGRVLAEKPLGEWIHARYGQPYATIHRADALNLLVQAVKRCGQVTLHLQERVRSVWHTPQGVAAHTESGRTLEAQALVGCDGLWSVVRRHVLAGPAGLVPGAEPPLDAPPRFTGHVAYRGMVKQADLPEWLRTHVVTAWLGPGLHVVHYPVRRGAWVNIVAVVEGRQTSNPQSWSHEANRADLMRALGPACPALTGMLDAVEGWKLWPLNDRPPMAGAFQHAQGRVALAGDAAHPMRPYLAQGAAMALEDAWTLGQLLAQARAQQPADALDWAAVFQRYAQLRWRRNARVQSESARNGRIFHADGGLRWGRNVALQLLGERLLDKPWLYAGPPSVLN